jgi:hypothetical protein
MKGIPEKVSKEVKEWLVDKMIARVKVVRPTKEEKKMYESVLGPIALKIIFTDGTSIRLDSWIGEFKLVPSTITGVQNSRTKSYFTITRKEVK